MDWTRAQELLQQMAAAYNQDSIRKITFSREIYPLMLRFEDNERSADLYDGILSVFSQLMKEIS